MQSEKKKTHKQGFTHFVGHYCILSQFLISDLPILSLSRYLKTMSFEVLAFHFSFKLLTASKHCHSLFMCHCALFVICNICEGLDVAFISQLLVSRIMTERLSHDVNVMLFKCVSQLLKLLRREGVLFKPKDVFTLCRCYKCVLFIPIILFQMQQIYLKLQGGFVFVECTMLFLRAKCKLRLLFTAMQIQRSCSAFAFPNQYMSLILCAPKKQPLTVLLCCCTCICKTSICLHCCI